MTIPNNRPRYYSMKELKFNEVSDSCYPVQFMWDISVDEKDICVLILAKKQTNEAFFFEIIDERYITLRQLGHTKARSTFENDNILNVRIKQFISVKYKDN